MVVLKYLTSCSSVLCKSRQWLIWYMQLTQWLCVNTLRPRQNGRHFADDIFKCIFLNEKVYISIKISLKFVPKGPFNNTPVSAQIMDWRRPDDKPLSEPMMVSSLMHICVTRPQWVKGLVGALCSTVRGAFSFWNIFVLFLCKFFHLIYRAMGR